MREIACFQPFRTVLTARRFEKKAALLPESANLYKTGDIGRWNALCIGGTIGIMKINLPCPNEQRRVEQLLAKLAKLQRHSTKAASRIRMESMGFSTRTRNFNAGLAAQST
jgi:hypothetical protein